VRGHHLGPAQHERAAVAQRVVEVPQDPALRLRVEVHQGVAAHEDVQPRDRRVRDQVVAPEDERPAQVLAEREPSLLRLEVPLAKLVWQALRLPRAVGAVPGHRQRPLVDVGGVDLDAVQIRVAAQQLREDHRQRVRLLAGRAAGTPHPDRLVVRLARQQCGKGGLAQVLPGGRVAEELRDVDEDGVEELLVLVRVDLQEVLVVAEAVDLHLLHPAPDPPLQARPLVAGEVEPAGALQEAQQRLERGIGRRRARHAE
jgi:hypothetical protein